MLILLGAGYDDSQTLEQGNGDQRRIKSLVPANLCIFKFNFLHSSLICRYNVGQRKAWSSQGNSIKEVASSVEEEEFHGGDLIGTDKDNGGGDF